jgi:hypothetical protein
MKIKLNKIVNSIQSLKSLSTQTTTAKQAFRLARALNAIQAELDIFDETKNTTAKKYQTTTAEGALEITPENAELFKKEILELLDEELEINIDLIPISEMTLNMTVSSMMTIDYLFRE